ARLLLLDARLHAPLTSMAIVPGLRRGAATAYCAVGRWQDSLPKRSRCPLTLPVSAARRGPQSHPEYTAGAAAGGGLLGRVSGPGTAAAQTRLAEAAGRRTATRTAPPGAVPV